MESRCGARYGRQVPVIILTLQRVVPEVLQNIHSFPPYDRHISKGGPLRCVFKNRLINMITSSRSVLSRRGFVPICSEHARSAPRRSQQGRRSDPTTRISRGFRRNLNSRKNPSPERVELIDEIDDTDDRSARPERPAHCRIQRFQWYVLIPSKCSPYPTCFPQISNPRYPATCCSRTRHTLCIQVLVFG